MVFVLTAAGCVLNSSWVCVVCVYGEWRKREGSREHAARGTGGTGELFHSSYTSLKLKVGVSDPGFSYLLSAVTSMAN